MALADRIKNSQAADEGDDSPRPKQWRTSSVFVWLLALTVLMAIVAQILVQNHA